MPNMPMTTSRSLNLSVDQVSPRNRTLSHRLRVGRVSQINTAQHMNLRKVQHIPSQEVLEVEELLAMQRSAPMLPTLRESMPLITKTLRTHLQRPVPITEDLEANPALPLVPVYRLNLRWTHAQLRRRPRRRRGKLQFLVLNLVTAPLCPLLTTAPEAHFLVKAANQGAKTAILIARIATSRLIRVNRPQTENYIICSPIHIWL